MLRIVLPLPPVALNPHAKGSRWPKINATKEYREAAMMAAFLALGYAMKGVPAKFERATISATFYCGPSAIKKASGKDGLYRPLDSTNAAASLKAAIDGLVDAGVVGKDDHRHVRMMPPVLRRTKKEHLGRAEVVLEIEEWAAGAAERKGETPQ